MGAGRGSNGAVLGIDVAVVTALLAWRCAAAAAQAPPVASTDGGGSGCMPELVSLSPCMGYMSGNATAPAAACCSALSGVLRSSPRCLCMVLGGTAASLGVAVGEGAPGGRVEAEGGGAPGFIGHDGKGG
uniref:Bifunctional inhibitor/plant lipid transfer protein/seed storage helical domain-containing protein n=1 Tax=Oryza glumipatula TaxID=40148 RepID=A0A0D9ZEB3_9ORYZ